MTAIPFTAGGTQAPRGAPATVNSIGSVVTHVRSTTTSLRHLAWTRTALFGVGAGAVVAVILLLAAQLLPSLITHPWLIIALSVATALAAGYVVGANATHISPVVSALWIEEQQPAGFALVTLIEMVEAQSTPRHARSMHNVNAGTDHAIRARLADAYLHSTGGLSAGNASIGRALRARTINKLRDPLLFVVVSLAMLTWSIATIRSRADLNTAGISSSNNAGSGATSDALRPIGAWRVRLEPPSYSGLPTQTLGDVESVHALNGSHIIVQGDGSTIPTARTRALGNSATVVSNRQLDSAQVIAISGGWQVTTTAAAIASELRIRRGPHARLLLIDGVTDSIPLVMLRLPARDSVMRSPTGRLQLDAVLHDDLGLRSASFELIVSSGEGERFTARTIRVGVRQFRGERNATLHAALVLDSLKLGAGDLIHMRAVARDAFPSATRESGSSETRSFRVARPSEYDSVSVEPAPPPEVDKSLMSERMLLMLTERLDARRPKMTAVVYGDESRNLAREQAKLRLLVGDAVFQRLGVEASAEDSHTANAADEHGITVIGGKLVATGAGVGGVSATGMLEEGEDSPVISVNKPLLEAYNAMWDAGRALELADTRGAIPHMRIALAAIERARAASRIYLRGKPPAVILDLDKIRLAGKDTGVTNVRSARLEITPTGRRRESRLLLAAALVVNNVSAARDSVAVLRLEAVPDAAPFAAALTDVLEAMRRGGDVTEQFIRARRVLGGVTRVPNSAWSRSGMP